MPVLPVDFSFLMSLVGNTEILIEYQWKHLIQKDLLRNYTMDLQ